MKVPQHIKEEVDQLREKVAADIKAIAELHAREPGKWFVNTPIDWEDRKRGRNGKLDIATVLAIYGPAGDPTVR